MILVAPLTPAVGKASGELAPHLQGQLWIQLVVDEAVHLQDAAPEVAPFMPNPFNQCLHDAILS
jgi:hypothetical protein